MNSKLLMVATGIIFLAACNVPKENEMKWFDRAAPQESPGMPESTNAAESTGGGMTESSEGSRE